MLHLAKNIIWFKHQNTKLYKRLHRNKKNIRFMANTTDLFEQQPLYSLQSHEIAPNRVDSNNKGNREKKKSRATNGSRKKKHLPARSKPGHHRCSRRLGQKGDRPWGASRCWGTPAWHPSHSRPSPSNRSRSHPERNRAEKQKEIMKLRTLARHRTIYM